MSRSLPLDRRSLLARVAGGPVRWAATAADQALDVQVLQTAASVENAVIAAYDVLLGLPILSSAAANPLVKGLLTTARSQHADHAAGYNDIAGRLGGKAQTGPNAALAAATAKARPGLSDIGPAVELALLLESEAAQTFQNNLGLLTDVNARRLTAAVLAVESQHVGLLTIAKFLVGARAVDLISLDSGVAGRLPPDAVKAAFPDTFAKTDRARPAAEGAVK